MTLSRAIHWRGVTIVPSNMKNKRVGTGICGLAGLSPRWAEAYKSTNGSQAARRASVPPDGNSWGWRAAMLASGSSQQHEDWLAQHGLELLYR